MTYTQQLMRAEIDAAACCAPRSSLCVPFADALCSSLPVRCAESEDSVDAAVKCAGKEVAGRMIRVDYAPVRERKSFGGEGGAGGRGGRGGRGGGSGGFGGDRGGRGGGRGGASGGFTPNKSKATMGGFSGKKVSFD